jgi:hypothetical protein
MNLKIMIFVFSSLFGTSCFQASDDGGKAVQGLGEAVDPQFPGEQEHSRKLNQWLEEQGEANPELMKTARIHETTKIAAHQAARVAQIRKVTQAEKAATEAVRSVREVAKSFDEAVKTGEAARVDEAEKSLAEATRSLDRVLKSLYEAIEIVKK